MAAPAAAPEVPALGALLGAMLLCLCWVAATGAQVAWRRSLGALLTWLADLLDRASVDVSIHGFGKVIHVFGPLSAALRSLVSTVDHYLGEAALWSEKGASVLFRFFLDVQRWIAGEIANLATDTWHGLVAARASAKAHTAAWARGAVAYIVHKLTVALDRIEHHTIPRVEHKTAQTAVREKVHHRQTTIAIDRTGVRVGITSRQLRRLGRRVGRLEKKLTGTAAVALVTAALVKMGFKFVKCAGWQRVGRRVTCGMSKFFESLLGLAIDALAITHLCQITLLLTKLGVLAQPMVTKLTTGVGALMECQGASVLPALPLPKFELPDVEGDGLTL